MRPVLLLLLATLAAAAAPKIAWWPNLEQARTEAARTGKPLLVLSAAPHCRNISGMW